MPSAREDRRKEGLSGTSTAERGGACQASAYDGTPRMLTQQACEILVL